MNTTAFPNDRSAGEQRLFTRCLKSTTPPGSERRIDPRLKALGEHTVRVNGAGERLVDGMLQIPANCEVVDVDNRRWAVEPIQGYQERRKRVIVQALTRVQRAYEEGTLEKLKARSEERAERLEAKVEKLQEVQARECEWLARARRRVWEGAGNERLGVANSSRPVTAEIYSEDTWREVRESMKEKTRERARRIRKKKRQRDFRRYIPEVVGVYREERAKWVEEQSEGNDTPKPTWSVGTEKSKTGQQDHPEDGDGSQGGSTSTESLMVPELPDDIWAGEGKKSRVKGKQYGRELAKFYGEYTGSWSENWTWLWTKLEDPTDDEDTQGRNKVGRVREAFDQHPDVDEPDTPEELCELCYFHFDDVRRV